MLKRNLLISTGALAMLVTSGLAQAQDFARARMNSFNEIPAISAPGNGSARANINRSKTRLRIRLIYRNLGDTATITAAHLHLGKASENGDVIAWVCGAGGPEGTPDCPPAGTELITNITAAEVIGTGADPGDIEAGDFDALVRAIRLNAVYINAHSTDFASGHLRGQF